MTVSTGKFIAIKIGTRTSGPPVPLTEEAKPVPAPITNKSGMAIGSFGISACFSLRRELMPENIVSKPIVTSNSRGLAFLTAQAPAKAAGAAARHSHTAMLQRNSIFATKMAVATRPDTM